MVQRACEGGAQSDEAKKKNKKSNEMVHRAMRVQKERNLRMLIAQRPMRVVMVWRERENRHDAASNERECVVMKIATTDRENERAEQRQCVCAVIAKREKWRWREA